MKLNKIDFRKKAKEIRNSLDIEKISEKIVLKIKNLDAYKNAKHVMLFYPLMQEINLLALLEDEKTFYLPRIKGEDMEVCPYKKDDKMSVSSFKTQEPFSEAVNPEILDVIFIPALMVDKTFHRLGYGKGFYDKFLSKYGLNAIKIVPIADQLIVDKLPSDEFDKTFDIIITKMSEFKK